MQATHIPGATYVTTVTNYASFMRRAAASLIDGILLVIVDVCVAIVLALAFGADFFATTNYEETTFNVFLQGDTLTETSVESGRTITIVGTLWWSALELLNFAYYIPFNARGATLGKMALGIRIVDAAGTRPGMRRALLRAVISFTGWGLTIVTSVAGMGFLLAFYYLFAIVDILSMIWHVDKQTFHDRMAGTYVIRA